MAHCSRCQREFSSQSARQQHYDNSARHNRCDVCNFDGLDWDALLQHHRDTDHRTVCQGCDDGEGVIWDATGQEYLNHLVEENVCPTCQEHFASVSNLENHMIVHLTKLVECYGCDRKFAIYPAMIIHLESGACDSGINHSDLNRTAASCLQWKAYLNGSIETGCSADGIRRWRMADQCYLFRCPGCDVGFTKLSGLFQHVYSSACDQELSREATGKLIRWLEKRHGK